MARFVFHLPGSWLGPFGSGLLPFYERLTGLLMAQGHEIALEELDRKTVLHRVEADSACHVVNHGRVHHPRALNAGIAYIYPFWNMDPKGIRAFSSIAGAPFDPGAIDTDTARTFMRRQRKRLVEARTSRYPQPEEKTPIPEGALAVFLQSEKHRVVGETLYLDRMTMLRTALESWDGPVVVKPHPRDELHETRNQLDGLKQEFPKLEIMVCNIHDLLARCARVLTINSAVGVEAYLHRKPVTLCGQSDFHHIADVAKTPAELAQSLGSEPRKRAYDKFVWWYFAHHCLSTTEDQLLHRFLARWDD